MTVSTARRSAGTSRIIRCASAALPRGACISAHARLACVLAVACCVASTAAVSAAAAETVTFTYTAHEQTFTVPPNVFSVAAEAVGASGAVGGVDDGGAGGPAAVVAGELNVTPGETLYVEVGGNGGESPFGGTSGLGGFNGGGSGMGGGGGATDVRTMPAATGLTPDDRLIVAGGGGGGGGEDGLRGLHGGEGGAAGANLGGRAGQTDASASEGGTAGTQTGGGIGGASKCGDGGDGRLGSGGAGSKSTSGPDLGGGGGGGYYGGGAGGAPCEGSAAAGGGGSGSSLVPPGGTFGRAVESAPPEVLLSYTVPLAPSAQTMPATSVTQTSMKLNATVSSNGAAVTSCAFEYGPAPSYGSSVPCSALPPNGSGPSPVSAAISGLHADTTYQFRIVATNEVGTGTGTEETATTLPLPAKTVTAAASDVGPTGATLNATVDAEGTPVTGCSFEYGTSSSYGSIVPCSVLPGAGDVPVAVSAPLTDLSGDTTYHFRIVATNAGGVSAGADESVTTAEDLPELGRCVKLQKQTGRYLGRNCTTESEGEDTGAFEWTPGPGSDNTFAFKNRSATLETTGRVQIECKENTLSGEYSGAKTANLHLKLEGCEPSNRLGIKCETQGAAAGEIVVAELDGRLGVVAAGVTPAVGMALVPAGAEQPPLAEFHCAEVPVVLAGGVIASYRKLDAMVSAFTVGLIAKQGIQQPVAFLDGSEDSLSFTIGAGPAEQGALKARDKVTDQEYLEIKAVP
jgi:Glycine rich protein